MLTNVACDVETQEEANWQDRCWAYEKLAKGISVPFCDHGVNVDIWCADSGGGGTGPSGLHLHHPGGLSRCLHLHTLCDVRQEGQRKLCQNMELDQGIRPSQQLAEDHSSYTSGECPHSAHGATTVEASLLQWEAGGQGGSRPSPLSSTVEPRLLKPRLFKPCMNIQTSDSNWNRHYLDLKMTLMVRFNFLS